MATLLIYLIFPGITALAAGPIRVGIFGRFRADREPDRAYNPYELSLAACDHPKLFNLNSAGDIQGDLAESWSFGKNGRTVSIKLRQNSGFSAQDIRKWIIFLLEHEAGGFHRDLLGNLLEGPLSVSTPSPDKIVFRLNRPYSPFLYLLSAIEFQVPKAFWPPAYKPEHEVITQASNSSYLVRNRKSASPEIEATVLNDSTLLRKKMGEGAFDVVIGLTPMERTSLPLMLGFETKTFNGLNSMFFSFRRNGPRFQDPSVRAALAKRLRATAAALSAQNPFFAPQTRLIPRGVLPQEYYRQELTEPSPAADQVLLERFKDPMRIWVSSGTFPPSFKTTLEKQMTIKGKSIATVEYLSYDQAIAAKVDFDIVISDAGSFFPDPDSFLRTWSLTMPEKLFPFVGKDLLKRLEKFSGVTNPALRLTEYSKAIRKFEEEMWVVPVFLFPEIVMLSKGNQIQLPAYRYADNLCRALLELH